MMRRGLLVVVLVCLTLGLGACGKKGRPDPPEDAVWPRQYPSD